MSFSWQDIWRMVKRWWWLAVISVVLAGGTSYHFASQKDNIYAARTRLMVGSSIRNLDPDSRDFSLSITLAQAYAEMVRQRPVIQGVVQRLALPMEWWQLTGNIKSGVIPSAQLLEITVIHSNPEFAALVANALADELILQSPASSREEVDRDFIRQELRDTQAKIEEAQDQISGLQESLLSLTSAAELAEAKGRLAELEELKLAYRSAYVELANLVSTQSPNSLTVVEPASPPRNPIAPSPKKEALMAAMAGLALAIGAVLLLEFADDTLRVDDPGTESVMGLPLLGTVPRLANGRCEPRSPQAELIRQFRTKVLLSSPRGHLKSLLITSPQPGDGKTVVAANLGIAMAGGGSRVVIVDADMRAPALHEWFDQPNLAGLADLLTADRALCEQLFPQFLRETSVPGLSLISAGRPPLDPSILLASPNMAALLELLSDQFDLVLFDSPPVLAAPDALILAMMAQEALLVLSPDRTGRRSARRAKAALEARDDTHVIGVALNRTSLGRYAYPYYAQQEVVPERRYQLGLPRVLVGAISSLPIVGRPDDPDLITLPEAAIILGVRGSTVKRWRREGRLPAVRRGLRWWVNQDGLEDISQNHQMASSSSDLQLPSSSDGRSGSQNISNSIARSADNMVDSVTAKELANDVSELHGKAAR